MPTIEDIKTWQGEDAHGPEGEKLGTIADVYVDRDTGEPEWLALKTGMFGTRVSFAPLAQATRGADGVRLPYTKDQIKDAPHADADGDLSPEEEAALYRHYGLDYDAAPADFRPATGDATTGRGPVGEDVSGPTTDEAMTRSEEELHVGTEARERGRARLRKYVVTEPVETTVPVRREEVRVEREPITDANVDRATAGPEISEEEHEVVLREERPVVEKRVVPKERVRLDTETVTEEREVSEEVRKEHIEADGDQDRRP
jgi:uncharacterized protein (TIGR02271 family)